jgi:predicted LPLAT superfamily acyltransferase
MRRRADGALTGRQPPEWVARPEWGRWFARAGVRIALALGRPLTWSLLYAATFFFLVVSSGDRAVSRQYLRRALGREPTLLDVFRHFQSFATAILDRVYLLNGQYDRFDVRVQGEEIVAGMLARGQGCLLLGAHFGSFEIVRFLGRAARVPRISLVMYEENTRTLNAALNAINPGLAMRVISLGRIDSMLQVERVLAEGEFVGMLADRTLGEESAMPCPFLGAPARIPVGPFRIAAMLRQPVILMLGVYRGGNRYDIHFEKLADMSDIGRPDRERSIEEALRSYVRRLEHHCRAAPYNWFNFYDYWS